MDQPTRRDDHRVSLRASRSPIARPVDIEIPNNNPTHVITRSGASPTSSCGDDSDSDSSGPSVNVEEDEAAEAVVAELNTETEARVQWSGTVVRVLALLCACSLSIGSHYGSYFLGPLKSRLSREVGTSNTEFSLLIAAFNINNTWTPLAGGILAARLGTALTSIIATSFIFFGQSLLLLGDYTGSVRLMVIGLFVFGLGISPLAVVQETIIVRFFSKHGLGISMALGLVAGKFTSFLSAWSSYPLSQRYGPHAPFVVATLLAALSCGFNVIYLLASSWFTRGAGLAPEAADVQRHLDSLNAKAATTGTRSEREALEIVAAKRKVNVRDLARLGDVFWLYIAVNVLCGVIWSPLTHLAANIFEKRYEMSELEASDKASLLLAGSLFLYPLCGFLTDRLRKGPIVHYLFSLSSALTLVCYIWLALPPRWTETPTPAVIAFGAGHGFSTLLLVIIVPHLVPIQFVSTALGAHKSMESSGSTVSKILAGLLLDTKNAVKQEPVASPASRMIGRQISAILRPPIDNRRAIQWLLNVWLLFNLLQFVGTVVLWKLDVRRKMAWALTGGGHSRSRSFSGFRARSSSPNVDYRPLPSGDDNEREQMRRSLKLEIADTAVVANPWAAVANESALEAEASGSRDSPSRSRPTKPHRIQGSSSPKTVESPLLPSSPTSSSPSPTSNRLYTLGVRYEQPPAKEDGHQRTLSFVSSVRDSAHFDGGLTRSRKERRRGKIFMMMSVGLVLATWALFFTTAVAKIRQKKD
ncbi:hypothetical protein FRB94_006858 [Tulasnella sp. JGI-2019a]|nr:hypothetical protein FRB94_006858 [Tulasnella sp. JGI-2019a]KAG9035844.1 hypothetical protein FRB95_010438 [Tulasnella sp. JGI-2019a]